MNSRFLASLKDDINDSAGRLIQESGFFNKVDIYLVASFLFRVSLVVLSFLVINFIFDYFGILDNKELQPVEDERILTSFRDKVLINNFITASYNDKAREIILSKNNEGIHTYNLRTNLWKEEAHELGADNITRLRVNCGDENNDKCNTNNLLWGISDSSESLLRDKSKWFSLIENSQFLDRNGTPLNKKNITVSAVSKDKDWLLLGGDKGDVGLYDLKNRRWIPLSYKKIGHEFSGKIQSTLWWDNNFIIKNNDKLYLLLPNKLESSIIPFNHNYVEVSDLTVSSNQELILLAKKKCKNPEKSDICQTVISYESISSEEKSIIDELDRPDLALSKLFFAKLKNNHVIVAGKTGVFHFDFTKHSWHQDDDREITTVVDLGKTGFIYAHDGGVTFIADEYQSSRNWKLSDKVIQLIPNKNDEFFALTSKGDIYALKSDEEVSEIFYQSEQEKITLDTAKKIVPHNNNILLLDGEKAFIIDYLSGDQSEIIEDKLPSWLLTTSNAQLTKSEDYIYKVNATKESAEQYAQVASLNELGKGIIKDIGKTASITKPRMFRKWKNKELAALDAQGQLLSLLAEKDAELLIGPPDKAVNKTFDDILLVDDGLFTITNKSVRKYDFAQRAFSDNLVPENIHSPIESLILTNEKLLAKGDYSLFDLENGTSVIGDSQKLTLYGNLLSDVFMDGGDIFLSGNDSLINYNSKTRKLNWRYSFGKEGSVDIIGRHDGGIISLWDSIVRSNDQAILPNEGAVTAAYLTDGKLFTQRSENGSSFILSNRFDDEGKVINKECIFRSPRLQGADKIIDARTIDHSTGWSAVLTNTGLHFYSKKARSWFKGSDFSIPENARLYKLGDSIVWLWKEDRDSHFFGRANINDLKEPHSCQKNGPKVNVQPTHVRSIAVDENNARLAWIGLNGDLFEWANGKGERLLAPSKKLPSQKGLRRVFQHKNNFIFTSKEGLWFYKLDNHAWRFNKFNFGSSTTSNEPVEGQFHDVTVVIDGDDIVVSYLKDNDSYVGTVTDDEGNILLKKQHDSAIPAIKNIETPLIDIANLSGNLWGFLFDKELKIFNPEKRSWVTDISFPKRDQSRKLGTIAGVPVVVEDGGDTWQVLKNNTWDNNDDGGINSNSFDQYFHTIKLKTVPWKLAVDSDANLFKLKEDGSVLKCGTVQPNSCAVEVSAPISIDPTKTLVAYEWEVPIATDKSSSDKNYSKRVLFSGKNTLTLYNPDTFSEIKISDTTLAGETIKDVLLVDNTLWMLLKNGKLIALAENGDVRLLAENTKGIFTDSKDKIWVNNSTGLKYWDVNKRSLVTLESLVDERINESIASFTITGESSILVLTKSGSILEVEGDRLKNKGLIPCEALPLSKLFKQDEAAYLINDCLQSKVSTVDILSDNNLSSGTQGAAFSTVKTITVDEKNYLLKFLHEGNDTQITITPVDGKNSVAVKPSVSTKLMVKSTWEEWKKLLVKDKLGNWWLDPVTHYVEKGASLYAARVSGKEELLAVRGGISVDYTKELDVGWLRWNRKTSLLEIKQPFSNEKQPDSNKVVTLKSEEFIKNGELIFGSKGHLIADDKDSRTLINQHGIWYFSDEENLSLSSKTNGYYPAEIGIDKFFVAHDRIITVKGEYSLEGKPLEPLDFVLSYGDACFQEKKDGTGIRARHLLAKTSSDTTCDAIINKSAKNIQQSFADQGFKWDVKRSVGYINGELTLHSQAGIHPVKRPVHIDAGPLGLARLDELRLYGLAQQTDELYMTSEYDWFDKSGSTWQPTKHPYPDKNWTMLSDTYWTWKKVNGLNEIRLAGKQQQMKFIVDGLGFSSDRLKLAAQHNNQTLVISDAFIETFTDTASMSTGNRLKYPHKTFDRLDTFFDDSGVSQLYARYNQKAFVWSWMTQKFTPVPIDKDPYIKRTLAQSDRLKFVWDRGTIDKYIKVQKPDTGQSEWVSYQFSENGFPFDEVTAAMFHDGKLFVGTKAGLEIYDDPSNTSVDGISSLIDLRSPGSPTLATVAKLGNPYSAPGSVIAITAEDNACWQMNPASTTIWQTCKEFPEYFTRGSDRFWSWVYDVEENRAKGVYLDESGSPLPGEVLVANGRFPHDQIKDLRYCKGDAYILWQDKEYITRYSGAELSLQREPRTYDVTGAAITELHCLEQAIDEDGYSLSTGLYAKTADEDNSLLSFSGSNWDYLESIEEEAILRNHLDGGVVFTDGRLRLTKDQETGKFGFEQQERSKQWYPIPWQRGHLSSHQFDYIFLQGKRLWAATPAGFVAYSQDADGKLKLDTQQFDVVRDLTDIDGKPCRVTDLQALEGSVLVRCNNRSEQLFAGTLPINASDEDRDVFVQMEKGFPDVFAEKTLIFSDGTKEGEPNWNWRLVNHKNESSGHLEVELNGEPLSLSAGRFNITDIKSITAFETGYLDVVTHGSGWYRLPTDNWHIKEFQRVDVPIDTKSVIDTKVTLSEDSKGLCLDVGSQGKHILKFYGDMESNVEVCAEYLAYDGVWDYFKTDKGLQITKTDYYGRAGERSLKDGRFGDDKAIGFPVVTENEGDGRYYYIPTEDGILQLNSQFEKEDVLFGMSVQSPAAIYRDEQDRLFVMNGSELTALDAEAGIDPVRFEHMPESLPITDIVNGHDDTYKLSWQYKGKEEWGYFARDGKFITMNQLNAKSPLGYNEWSIQFPRQKPPVLYLKENAAADYIKSGLVEPDKQFNRLFQVIADDRLFILEPDEFWEVNLGTAKRRILNGTTQQQAPDKPDFPPKTPPQDCCSSRADAPRERGSSELSGEKSANIAHGS